jgi:hypothetical protein
VRKLVDAVQRGADPAAAGLGVPQRTARALGALLRLDSRYGHATRRLARLDHQMRGLSQTLGELEEAKRRLATPGETRPQSTALLGRSPLEQVERIEAQLAEMRRLLRDIRRSGNATEDALEELEQSVTALGVRARAARAALPAASTSSTAQKNSVGELLLKDQAYAVQAFEQSKKLRSKLEEEQVALAKDALLRLDRRVSRLIRRARLGRIETVLGKKRALEIEVEALSQGLLPHTIVDSLDAERYLRDDEEYWPFDGEDWEDEYVGGEGLR